jgi:hypothetical protein
MFIMSEWNRRRPEEGEGVVAWKGEECHHWLQLELVQVKPASLMGSICSHYSKGFEMKHI